MKNVHDVTTRVRTWELPPQVKTVLVNGYELAYLERGTGIPVILVHGSISDYRYWITQIRPFSERYRAISVSLRHSYPEPWDGTGDDFSIRQHVEDLLEFIRGLHAGPVHLVAHSYGADVALLLASAHSELLRSLVLAEPAPLVHLLPATQEAAKEVELNRIIFKNALGCLQRGDLECGLKIFMDGITGPGTWDGIPEGKKYIFLDNAWSLKCLFVDTEEPVTCADVGKIDVPVLLINGDKSARVYRMMMEGIQRCIRHYELIIIPFAAHAMNHANPQVFNAAVLDFMDKH
jgi:pimeloyl-ACP methyl ester carboxylesterase